MAGILNKQFNADILEANNILLNGVNIDNYGILSESSSNTINDISGDYKLIITPDMLDSNGEYINFIKNIKNIKETIQMKTYFKIVFKEISGVNAVTLGDVSLYENNNKLVLNDFNANSIQRNGLNGMIDGDINTYSKTWMYSTGDVWVSFNFVMNNNIVDLQLFQQGIGTEGYGGFSSFDLYISYNNIDFIKSYSFNNINKTIVNRFNIELQPEPISITNTQDFFKVQGRNFYKIELDLYI